MSPPLKKLLKFARRNPKSMRSALRASAAPPSSGFAFIDNSQGSSAAVAELSVALGELFEDFDLDGELEPQIQLLTKRLDEEGSQYCNSQLKDEQCQTWSSTQEEARLIAIAWKCADESYSKILDSTAKTTQSLENCILTQDHVITPTSDGTVKTAVFTTVSPNDSSNDLLPMLVIAIRGSASNVDHMVNANGDARDVKGFIDLSRFLDHGSESSFQAHSGFLGCTAALDSFVSKRIQHYKETSGSKHVLFTGHSAGGAVASLLFLRNLSRYTDDSACFSCITFGAPPTVCSPVSLNRVSSSSKGLCLNFINEFDLVTRVDKPYILSLVNLIRTMYNQPPLPDQSTYSITPRSTTDSVQAQDTVLSQLYLEENIWAVPRAVFSHVGPRIVLRRRLEGEGIKLHAAEISQTEFEKLLFCGVAVHKREDYGARVKSLASGRFNGAEGWGL